VSVVPAVELNGLDLALLPLSNRLLALASDAEAIATNEAEAPKPNMRLVNILRRDAAQLRAVRELLHSGGFPPHVAHNWATVADRYITFVRAARGER
jgi:hypothetical protein